MGWFLHRTSRGYGKFINGGYFRQTQCLICFKHIHIEYIRRSDWFKQENFLWKTKQKKHFLKQPNPEVISSDKTKIKRALQI